MKKRGSDDNRENKPPFKSYLRTALGELDTD